MLPLLEALAPAESEGVADAVTVLVGEEEAEVVEQAEEDVLGVWLLVPVPLCVAVGVTVELEACVWESEANADTVEEAEGLKEVLPVFEALAA